MNRKMDERKDRWIRKGQIEWIEEVGIFCRNWCGWLVYIVRRGGICSQKVG